jgi:hypothetical protein
MRKKIEWLLDAVEALFQELGLLPKPVFVPTTHVRANGEIELDDGTWLAGADVEIWEQCTKNQAILKPGRIRINGVEVLMADVPFQVHPMGKRDPAKITVTMFIRTLTVHGVQPDA